ncbi:Flp pilus assembly protein CpaB [bacterium]|nr:MAG: Flp pilus assembly protein CpaB [bacterium]
MQRNNTPVLLITILLGVLALGATAFLMMGRSAPAPDPAAVGPTPTPTPAVRWVAINDIPPRTVVNSTMIRREAQSGAVPAGAIGSLDDLRGQITNESIRRGETVLLSSFNPSLQRQVRANIEIPSGFRGVAIWVDPTQTAAGLVDAGDRVDIIANHKLSYDKAARQYVVGSTAFTAGRTIAQNLLVLGVDKSIEAPAPTPTPVPGAPAAAPGPPPAPTPAPPPSATSRTRVLLAAPPEIASRLVAANDQGTLHITIRNPNDGDQDQVPETREYPSRLYTAAPDKTTTNLATNLSKSYDKFTKDLTGVYKDSLKDGSGSVPVMPADPAAQQPVTPTDGAISPDEKEITVVRGTEKTRVLVPRR